MKKLILNVIVLAVILSIFSCSSTHQTMMHPNVRIDLNRKDLVLSEQLTASATSKKIIGIDFQRLFEKKSGDIRAVPFAYNYYSIPVIGNIVSNPVANYALYELMQQEKGYDLVIYPQYSINERKPILGLGFIYKVTEVSATARLGKISENE